MTFLLVGRKSFSYAEIGGVYAIELLSFAAVGLFACALIVLNPRFRLRLPHSRVLKRASYFALLYVAYNVLRFLLSNNADPKNAVVGVYPIYFVMVYLISLNSNQSSLRSNVNFLTFMIAISPILAVIYSVALADVLGALKTPGGTFTVAASVLAGVFWVQSFFLATAVSFISLVLGFLTYERAVFLNIAFAVIVSLVLVRRGSEVLFVRQRFYIFSLFFVLTIIALPWLDFLQGEKVRFQFTYTNIFEFFYSIFSSDVQSVGGLAGTRSHRLEMWSAAMDVWSSSFFSVFFGVGYFGDVADTAFRNVHNGYVTILYRGGLVSLFLFLFFLFYIFRFFLTEAISGGRSSLFGLALTVAFSTDILTGTIIDSPFTSYIFYAYIAVLAAYLDRLKATLTHK